MYVCICAKVTDGQIKQAVADTGLCSLRELCKQLGVAKQCGSCCHHAKDVLQQALIQPEGLAPQT